LVGAKTGIKSIAAQRTANVRFGSKADIASLIDDFVGASDQGRRHGEPERFCGLEVDR
jgi:hypothetical protein